MTLNDLEPQNSGSSDFFRDFRLRRIHTQQVHFAEITGDRSRQPAYEIKLIL